MRIHIILFISLGLVYASVQGGEREEHIYKPEWADLNTRPLPQWHDQAKVGISIHWGVYSVPSFVSHWFWPMWKGDELLFNHIFEGNSGVSLKTMKNNQQKVRDFMKKHYAPDFTYQDFAADFKTEFFNASEWAKLFKASGAKYVVMESKDHEGFELWPSNNSFSWNSVDTGPRRDLVGEVAKAVRGENLKFGLLYGLFEWFNPLFIKDRKNKYSTQTFPSAKVWPDLQQIVEKYKPSIVWSHGGGGTGDKYWNSTGFIAWLYNSSPNKKEIVVNSAWEGPKCNHGDIHLWCDHPSDILPTHKWENWYNLDKAGWSWTFRRNAHLDDIKNIETILNQLVVTISRGGNILINVGPTKEGMISPIEEERLLQLGEWLGINGEAIYDTSPWIKQKDSFNGDVWYTCNRKQPYNGSHPTAPPAKGSDVHAVYVITLRWPDKEELIVQDLAPFMRQGSNVTLLGGKQVEWQYVENGARIKINLPYLRPSEKLADKKAWAVKVVFGAGACHELYSQYC